MSLCVESRKVGAIFDAMLRMKLPGCFPSLLLQGGPRCEMGHSWLKSPAITHGPFHSIACSMAAFIIHHLGTDVTDVHIFVSIRIPIDCNAKNFDCREFDISSA